MILKNKYIIGTLMGAAAGIVDVTPMILQNLTWDANLAAFSMWVVIGFLIPSVHIKLHPVVKGLLIAYMVLLPSAFLIGWHEPASLLPIFIMTTLLGALLGFFIHRFTRNLEHAHD